MHSWESEKQSLNRRGHVSRFRKVRSLEPRSDVLAVCISEASSGEPIKTLVPGTIP